MADDEDVDDDLEDDGENGDESSESGGKKKLLILIGVALLIVVGGTAGAYFTGLMQPLIDLIAGPGGEHTEEGGMVAGEEAVFYELEDILVNLNTGSRKGALLKIKVSLELEKEADRTRVEKLMPRIIDNFQVYLRELRVEDLKGSAGMYRLREELLTRVSAALAPVRVKDVLFKEMLVQ